MVYWRGKGLFLILFMMLMILACVPVEEKMDAPFDVSFQNETIRKIYGMQVRQEKDSLLQYLTNDDPSLRFAAARAFASFQDSTSLEALLPLLLDQNGQVRAVAAYAVGQIGSAATEAKLTAAFDGRDSARLYLVANSAILEAMGKIGSLQFLKALSTISTYQHSDTLLLLGQVRGIYQYSLRGMTDPEGTSTVVRYLSDTRIPNPVRLIAAHYLHRTANLDLSPHAAAIVASWHGESDPFLRMCIATALGKLKTPETQKLLTESLQTESDYRVKCNILRALQTFDYADVSEVMLEFAKSGQPAIAEVAAGYFVHQGKERDANVYSATINQCKTWQAKARMAEAANKNMTSMFTAAKTNLKKDILAHMNAADHVYEKAAWLKAYASELRNFESLPKYMTADQPVVIRTQAGQSLIDACRDKNFDTYFAGEGHLIRSQIGGYLANAMRFGDAGLLAIIAGAITDPKTGLKNVMNDRKAELSKAISGLQIPEEMETYLEIQKALLAYGIETPDIPEEEKVFKSIDWNLVDGWKDGSKAQLITSAGNMEIDLFPDLAPGSVSNFLQLASQRFYDDKPFHRVVPNFVVQTGCPRGDGYGNLDFTIRSELAQQYYDDEGYIGMASAGPHTEGTQFFITHSPTPHLDGRYTIFGKVTSGMDVLHRIGMGDTIKQIIITY